MKYLAISLISQELADAVNYKGTSIDIDVWNEDSTLSEFSISIDHNNSSKYCTKYYTMIYDVQSGEWVEVGSFSDVELIEFFAKGV